MIFAVFFDSGLQSKTDHIDCGTEKGENIDEQKPRADDGIVRAAYEEFLAYGYEKASLHKIAERAEVTTGAIYTRYKNKDALFVSLLQDFFAVLEQKSAPAAEEYERARQSGRAEDLLQAIAFEEKIYFDLLTEHSADCTLFLCRSDGSSAEAALQEMMRVKTEQTVGFFEQVYGKKPNAHAIRLLMESQFWYFRQLLNAGLKEQEMLDCLHTMTAFFDAGWRQLCESLI